MKAKSVALVATVAAAGIAAPPVQQKVTGPVATYWMSASTSSGFGFGGMGAGGGRPSMGDIFGMMRGGGGRANHALLLQLGSTQRATGVPEANHFPGTAGPLLLLTPQAAPPPKREETVEEQPDMRERPKGRILLYWGCGDHAGPGQPTILDFSKIMDGQPLPRLPYVAVRHETPPSAGRSTTYGEWPNSKSRAQPPASLLGDHAVRGNYAPEIKFSLPPGKDYMPPIQLTASAKSPAGATMLQWQPVAGATGYFTMLFGANGRGGRDEGADIVMWSSSGVSTFAGGGLLDYLAPAEARRLIGLKVVMPPTQTQCTIPTEVTQAAQNGLVSMIAYGDEANFVDPPRPTDPKVPWNISWQAKVRFKSTTGLILGMQGGMGGGSAVGRDDEQYEGRNSSRQQEQAPDQPQGKKKKGGGLFDALKGAVSPF